MKYAWWLIVGFVLFLLCTQQTFAAEVAGFDPTQQYVVHSVPLYTEGSVVVTFEDEEQSPVISPAEHTPEAGSEGKQEISLAESSTNVDLSHLTYAAKQRESSVFSNLGNAVSSWFSFMKDQVSSFMQSGWANASANLMQFSFTSLLAISARLNKWLGDLTFVLNKYIGFVREHVLSFALLSVAGPGLVLFASTAFGKAILIGAAHFVVAGVVSAADIVLHAGSYAFGLFNSLRTGVTVAEGYQMAKDFIKKKTGHDIGDAGFDLKVVATRLVVALMIFGIGQLLVSGVAAVGAISAETAPQLILRSSVALNRTSIDCNMPGQCDTPVGLGITAGSNFLFGIAPQKGMQLVDDEARVVNGVISQEANIIGAVKPKVSDAKLNNIVENLYKGIDNPEKVGSGTTADAIRYELKTGLPVSGRFHSQKGTESVQALNNWIKKNPDAYRSDIEIAKELIDDLMKALNGK